jgi:iron(III) transport system substrate-binding protein
MLSREGQALFARHNMIPLRDDMQGVPGAVVPANAREIHVGPALMADLDQVNRDRFFDKWTTSMGLKAAQDLNTGGRKAT